MKKKEKKRGVLFAVVSILALLSVLFAACSNGTTSSGGTVNKTALENAINSAYDLLDEVTASDDGSGLADGDQYAPQSAITAFLAAVNEAESVFNNTAATQAQVNDAVTALAAAKTAFEGSIGTVGGAANKGALALAISDAKALKTGVQTSDDGSGLAEGTKYAPAAAHAAYQTAIEAAETVNNKADATQPEVNAAVGALNSATNVFNTATKTVGSSGDPQFAIDSHLESGGNTITFEWAANGYYPDAAAVTAIENVPWGSYFRIEVEGLGADWPNNFVNGEYLRFAWFGASSSVGLVLVGLSDITDGKGDAFFAVDLVKEFMTSHPGDNPWLINYPAFANPGNNDTPYIAYYDADTDDFGKISLEVWVPQAGYGPTITGVSISPDTDVVIDKGTSIPFHATVTGTNNHSQAVVWSIEEAGKHAGTVININGRLTVDSAESLDEITVKATSMVDTSRSATVTVTLEAAEEMSGYERYGTLSLKWDPTAYFGVTGYLDGSDGGGDLFWPLMDMPEDSFLRVTFENLGADWPVTVDGKEFLSEYLHFGIADYSPTGASSIPLILEPYGAVEDGKGVVLINLKQLQDYIDDDDNGYEWWGTWFVFFYPEFGPIPVDDPRLVADDDGVVDFEIWVPEGWEP